MMKADLRSPGGVRLRAATPGDAAAVARLLESADLPVAGVADWLDRFVVAERDGVLEGAAGLEVHDDEGILRSVVVAESARGTGLGAALTEQVIAAARAAGLRRLYLLTTTAETWFPRHGFRRIDRAQVSEAAKRSVEFREACPATAVVMVRELRAPRPDV